jgi:hypothetical protein
VWYTSIARENLRVLNLKVINTRCGHSVSHSTYNVDNPIPSVLSPASLPPWLLSLWWSVALIREDSVAGVAYRRCPSRTPRERSRTGWGLETEEAKCVGEVSSSSLLYVTRRSIPKRLWKSRCTIITEFVLANCMTQNAFVMESPFCNKAVTLAAKERNTFPCQFKTNFESFSSEWCTSHDSRLTDYFSINIWNFIILLNSPV